MAAVFWSLHRWDHRYWNSSSILTKKGLDS
jgi:hypothetical protein